MKVAVWLEQLGLEQYTDSFLENEVDGEVLVTLTADDLRDLGVAKVGHRRKLLNAIAALSTSADVDTYPRSQSVETTTTAADSAALAIPASRHEAERRHLTIMFVDMVGSTELSTQLDAEEVREVITVFQNTVAGVIGRFEGFVARFMGDGVLCYFGWPRANEDDAGRAVRAGLSIIESVNKTSTAHGTPLSTRIGIASGLVIVGDLIGSGASEEAAVVGETPNLAARLQSLAAPNQLILPTSTKALLNNVFDLESTGFHSLKGIAEPVEAFVVGGELVQESRFAARVTGNATPLVGRGQELDFIRRGWAQAMEGHGQLILISGDAGIGKSRIVQAAIDEIKQNDHVRITAQCSPYHTESAFYPIIHQLQYASGIRSTDTPVERLQKLQSLPGIVSENIALIAAMMGIDASAGYSMPELTPAQLRAHTMNALVDTLLRQAEEKPVLVVFEDLHWMDLTTQEFLGLAIDETTNRQILVLATARPTFTHTFGGHPEVHRITLDRLGNEQVLSIVDEITDGRSIPDEVLNIIVERTDGIPLFVEELTKTIMESNVLTAVPDRYVLNGPLNARAIPNTLHGSLMARLDRLAPIKEVAQIAACIGREFNHRLIAEVSTLSDIQLSNALDGLSAAELIYRTGEPPEARYQFKHALVRDAAYESLLKPRRRGLHTNILQALETRSDTAPEVLAKHAEAARLNDRAIDLWEKASKAAIARPALDEAIAHISNAIALNNLELDANEPTAIDKALELQVQLGMALIARRGWATDETKYAFEKALSLADQIGETPARFSILYGINLVHFLRAEYHQAIKHSEEFIALAEQSSETAPGVVAHRTRGMALLGAGQFDKAQYHLEQSLKLFDPDRHKGLGRQYAFDLGVASFGLISLNTVLRAETQRASFLFNECERYGNECGEASSVCYMEWLGCIFSILNRDDAELQRHVTALVRDATEYKLSVFKHWSDSLAGILKLGQGDINGLESFNKGDAALVQSKHLFWVPLIRVEAARRVLTLGDRKQSGQIVETTLKIVANTDESTGLADLHRLQATLAKADGQDDQAEQHLLYALDIAQAQGGNLWALRAAIDFARLKSDQPDIALPVLQPLVDNLAEGDCPAERNQAIELITHMPPVTQ